MNRLAARAGTILLTVTSEQSLKLMSGFPERLASWGWDVHLVVGRTPAAPVSGVTWHELPMRRKPALVHDLLALGRWVRLLASIQPNVVMAGTPKAGMLGTLAAMIVGVPIRIYLLRGLRCSSERGPRRWGLAVFERLTAAASTTVLAVSPSLRREYIDLHFAPPDKVVVLGAGSSNGVDTGRATLADGGASLRLRRRFGLSDSDFIVGYVGRVTRDKDIATLLGAIRRLIHRGLRVKALVVGPEEPAGTLARCVEASGVDADSVVWAGEVESVDPYYRAMDVLCLPSRREGFPNVVLEAAIHAVPTVATRVTGCVDAVVEGTTGVLVTPGDREELSEALAQLATDESGRVLMGEKARTRAIQEFGQEEVWTRISDFLNAQTQSEPGMELK